MGDRVTARGPRAGIAVADVCAFSTSFATSPPSGRHTSHRGFDQWRAVTTTRGALVAGRLGPRAAGRQRRGGASHPVAIGTGEANS
jgi:hypothetical protein